jgi:hypothetical protein
MIILPSVFTTKRLEEIQRINEAVASLRELLEIVKAQRQLLQDRLGKIECSSVYARCQGEFDKLLLEERIINKAIDLELLKVLIDSGVEEKPCFVSYSVVES